MDAAINDAPTEVGHTNVIIDMQKDVGAASIREEVQMDDYSSFNYLLREGEKEQQEPSCAVMDVEDVCVGGRQQNGPYLWEGVMQEAPPIECGALRDVSQLENLCTPLLHSDGNRCHSDVLAVSTTYEPLVQELCNVLIVGDDSEPLSVVDMLRLRSAAASSSLNDSDMVGSSDASGAAFDFSVLNGSYVCFCLYDTSQKLQKCEPPYQQSVLAVDGECRAVIDNTTCESTLLMQNAQNNDANDIDTVRIQPQLQDVIYASSQRVVELPPEQMCWRHDGVEFVSDVTDDIKEYVLAISRLRHGGMKNNTEDITKIRVQLEPESLGHVEVEFSFSKGGTKIAVVSERFLTNELLRQGSGELLSQLQPAGSACAKPALSFSWNGERRNLFDASLFKRNKRVKGENGFNQLSKLGAIDKSIFLGWAVVPISSYKVDIMV